MSNSIVLTRIDDRLIHGQVMTSWLNYTSATKIMVVDDRSAQDPFLKTVLKNAVPKNVGLGVFTAEKAANRLIKGFPESDRVIILVKYPATICKMMKLGVKFDKVNIGEMTISVIQAILIGLLYYLGINGTPWTTLLGSTILQKPLVSGVLVGCILGDPVQGAIIGAAIQLPFIAYISAGGAPPTDPGLAGTLGTALAMAAGVKPEAAIAMAVPIGLLGTIIWVLHMTIDVFFVHMIDKAADEGNMKKAEFLHIVPPQIVALLLGAIPVALGCYFGSGVVTKIITLLDGTPLRTLEVIGGILPAIGIAMNLRAISKPGILMWYILGFIIAVYLNLATMPIAIIAGIVAYIYTDLIARTEEKAAVVESYDDADEDFI